MTLQEFNLKYLYKKDEREAWKPCEIKDGLYVGDCEDYCLSLQELMPKIHKKYDLYYCKMPEGAGHCVLGDGEHFIDCNYQKWVTRKKLVIDGHTGIKKFWKIDIWARKLSTKLFGYVFWMRK